MKNLILILLLSGILIACGEDKEETQDPEEMQEQTLSEQAQEDAADTTEEASVVEEDVEVQTKHEHEHKEEKKKTTTATKGSWTGKIVKMNDFIKGSSEDLDANRVKQLINAGQYVGFESNGTFYMVYNAAGNYDWKSLAKAAGSNSVTIDGDMKKVGGISIIIADNIAM